MAYDARWTSTDQIPQRAVDSGLIDRFGTLNPTDGGVTHRYSLSFEGNKSDDGGRSDIHLYAVKSDLKLFSDFTYALDHPNDPGSPISGDQFEQTEHRWLLGGDVSQSWLGKVAGKSSETRLGLQVRFDRLDPIALYQTVERDIVATTRYDTVSEASAGLFLSSTLYWSDRLRTVAGARIDGYRFDVNSDNAANSGRAHDSVVSPKFSAIWGPWARTEYFLNYGEGFHSNDARGATEHVTPLDGSAIAPVTPLVKSRGAEIGARTEIIPRLQSSIALWQLRLESELVFSGDAGDTESSRASKRYGIEWSNHYVASEWLQIDLDLSASNARFTQNDLIGNYIPGAVDRVAALGVSIDELGPWFAQFQLRYFGPRPLLEDNSERSRSTTLAYLRGGYRIGSNWKIAIDVFNLFDRKVSDIDYYYKSRLAGETADGVDDRHFHPVEPRSVRGSVTYKF